MAPTLQRKTHTDDMRENSEVERGGEGGKERRGAETAWLSHALASCEKAGGGTGARELQGLEVLLIMSMGAWAPCPWARAARGSGAASLLRGSGGTYASNSGVEASFG
ncbi:hypothetical protein ZWY2020_028854 [Hordeum vulgare]|nr:hypothetical protein ZWY2020_028854 [Hordeum vulgare]